MKRATRFREIQFFMADLTLRVPELNRYYRNYATQKNLTLIYNNAHYENRRK